MAIPKYDEIALPLLYLFQDGQPHHLSDLSAKIGEEFNLTDEERAATLPSGQSTYLRNRTGWASFHLKKAGLLDAVAPSTLRLTQSGRDFLSTNPNTKLTRAELMNFEPFRTYITQLRKKASPAETDGTDPAPDDESTPNERIEEAYSQLNDSLASELLTELGKMDPFRFEQLVVDLLFAMGYGGSREEAAKITKKTGDEGIDGVINEDRLGLDVIYIQAKRWQATVGRREIQSFVGALAGQASQKGVFITTSNFADTAVAYAKTISQKVILIDGPRLSELMIEHNIGVTTTRTISLKRIDSDYFAEG